MYSFDVFDTLITRTTATPWGIFALMKEKICQDKLENGLSTYILENFYELRIQSEELARKAGNFQGKEEVTLEDIYEAMAVSGCLNKVEIEYLIKLEKETEILNVVPISAQISYLKSLLEKGEKVVLISDMYLTVETIRQMLKSVDEELGKLPLYVSSEYGMRKTSGGLYRKVQELEKVNYEDWIHIGDNLYQDIEIPLNLGIHVEYVEKKTMTEFEESMLENYHDDARLQLITGAAIRADFFVEQNEKTTAYHIGSRYAGPILYMYGEWLVQQAIQKGINRLYFIARDGYLVKKVVDEVLKYKKSSIKTYYIYGSRKSWRMTSLSEEHYNLYQLILWSHVLRIRTLEKLADVLQISLEDLYVYLPGNYSEDKNNIEINNQELEYIAYFLANNEEFKKFHLQILAEKRKTVQDYLRQEIDVSDQNFAFVDVSGGGLTQACLYQLMKEWHPEPIRTFFFKIDRVNLDKNSITDTFMPSFLENNLTIEMICRAPHGQTMGYEILNSEIVPQLDNKESLQIIDYGFHEYEKGIIESVKCLCYASEINKMQFGTMKNVLHYFKYISQNPCKEVLEYFASMPSDEAGRGESVEYAPRLTRDDIKRIYLERTYQPVEWFYRGTDLKYSELRASEEEKELIERYKRECYSGLGRAIRQKTEAKYQKMRRQYGSAAFYPLRLLEKKIILYGAGKFGQNLYRRIIEDRTHEVILWVDKQAEKYREHENIIVQNVDELFKYQGYQIVIAVVKEELAMSIKEELRRIGILEENIFWAEPLPYPDMHAKWKNKGIG